MRLRTQFIITMCLFGIVLAAIAASAIITNYLVVKVMEQERRAFDIVRATGELDYLANEYLLYHETQQLGRWRERFASFTVQVSSLHADKPEQQQLVANINLNKNRLKEVFESVVSARESLSPNIKTAFDPVALQVSWSRMAVQAQGLEADALHLSRMLGRQEDKLRYARDVLLYIIIGLFGLFIITIYMLTYRRVLKSIAELRAGTAVIGSGNLDFAIKEKRNDEIGELYQDFNRMVIDLKVVTASKADLEWEIGERKLAEDVLRESKEQLSAVFDGVSETLMLLDIEGNIIAANKLAAKRFNQGKTDLVGKNIYDLIPVRFQKQRKELVSEMVSTKKPIKFQDRLEDVFLEIIFYPVFDAQGNVIQFVSFALDITERKRAEDALSQQAAQLQERSAQLEEINKELESFSYSVSHDLRAPLRAIEGYSRMILKKQGDKFDEDTITKFNVIRSNTQQMGNLIDELLNLSRLGKQEMALVKLDMASLIGEVWQELQVINPDRALELEVKDMPEASGDRILIKQVYLNLLGNSVKFTKHCTSANIEAGGYTKGNENVYYIKDNGAGFDMAYYDKLFGVFQRLHTTDEYEGTGIGLAIIQRIIHRHGGRVWAEGKVDKGATFYFTLPGK